MKKGKVIALLLCLTFSGPLSAAYRHFLFMPATPVVVNAGTLDVDDYTEQLNLSAIGGPNGWMQGKVLMAQCSGGEFSTPGKQDKTAWLMVPKTVTQNGVTLNINILDTNGWGQPNQAVPPGYIGKVAQRNTETPLESCWTVNSSQLANFYWRNATLNITVPKQKLKPGVYTLRVPYYYGYEENKYTDYPADAYDIPSRILNASGGNSAFTATIRVTSKCSFNTNQINLSHGTMVGRDANGNQTKPYNLNITCTPGTSLTAGLTGAQKIPGKTDNYTQCGTGGYCKLSFDNGQYKEKMTIDSGKTLSILSTYYLNDTTSPVAESFSGSGVLSILIN